MNTWTFYLDGLLIPGGWEPIGWDKVKFTIKREAADNGLAFTFSDSLQFDGYAAQILREHYNANFIDAYVPIRIVHCQGWTYNGVINFSIYKEQDHVISAGIKESGFSNLFTTRYEMPVDLSKNVGIDGLPLSPLTPISLPLHSKEIIFSSKFRINPLLTPLTISPIVPLIVYQPVPWQIEYADVEETLEPSSATDGYPAFTTSPLLYTGFVYPTGIVSRSIQVEGRLVFSASVENNFFKIIVALSARTVQSDTEVISLILYTNDSYVNNTTVDITVNTVLVLPADCNVYFSIYSAEIGVDFEVHDHVFTYNQAVSFLSFTENSLFPPSTAKAYLLYEAMNRVLESITGLTDVLVSDFLGRTDSTPTDYDEDGKGALIALTNGFAIRKFEDRPIVASFKKLFDAINASDCLGFRVEGEKIRVEPKQYFYRLEAIARFSMVKEINESVSLPDIYNEMEFEYSNQGDTKQINKLDEFNTKRNYATPIRQHKNKLGITTDVITSGYAIEFTRREQFSTSPTKDYPTDNQLFLIACLRNGSGYVPEKNEYYAPITGLISPSTVYNLRFAPVRCLHRWEKVFSGCLFRSVDKVVKFQSGTGNYLATIGTITENEDITADTENALFNPIIADFEVPLTFGEFLALVASSIYAIEYSCSRNNYQKAFIREVNYEPNREGGIALFKLIQANGNRDENLTDV